MRRETPRSQSPIASLFSPFIPSVVHFLLHSAYMELGKQFLFTIGVSIVLGMRAVMPQISNLVTLPAEFHLVLSGNSISRKRHESVMSSVMECGSREQEGS